MNQNIQLNRVFTEIIIPAGRRYINLPLIAGETILQSLDVLEKDQVIQDIYLWLFSGLSELSDSKLVSQLLEWLKCHKRIVLNNASTQQSQLFYGESLGGTMVYA